MEASIQILTGTLSAMAKKTVTPEVIPQVSIFPTKAQPTKLYKLVHALQVHHLATKWQHDGRRKHIVCQLKIKKLYKILTQIQPNSFTPKDVLSCVSAALMKYNST